MRVFVLALAWLALPYLVGRATVLDEALVALMGLTTLYTGLAALARHQNWGKLETRGWVTSAFDASFVLAAILVTGGWVSPFTPLLYVSMAAVAYRFDLVSSLTFGTAYTFGYLGVVAVGPTTVGAPVDLVLRAGLLVATGMLASMNSEGYLEAEREREQAEHTYENILETVPGLVTIVGRDGTIEYTSSGPGNAKAREARGVSLVDGLEREDQERVRGALRRVFEQGEAIEYEVPRSTSDDGTVYYRSVAAPLTIGGEVQEAVIVSVDITRRVRAEHRLRDRTRALEQSNEALARYARLTAHDLREPLRDIVRFLQRIDRREGDLAPESREELDYVVERSHLLDDLVAALHSFAEVDDRVFEIERIDLEDAVDEALLRVDPSGPPSLDLEVRDGHEITTDRRALIQVLEILIENAHAHANVDPVNVHVEGERTDDGWRIAVEDDGEGIEPRYHDLIFEPLHRLANQDRVEPGIGLATAQRLVERMGGEIDVESTPGEGSRFTFTVLERPVLADTDADVLASQRLEE